MKKTKKSGVNFIILSACAFLSLCSMTGTAIAKGQSNKEGETMLQMKIGETEVQVEWEENESVRALADLCSDEPLTIRMSMYGGFEQVGPIGAKLPRNDRQITTSSGDIVLYSGNQIVVFYGSNSWAYTRLGHITDRSVKEMTSLLANGDVTITISLEKTEDFQQEKFPSEPTGVPIEGGKKK